ncbi:MAG: AbrB/MazE/SpoVT family DNA-binding domain-containing protein [Acidobacteriaceae bacterium]
MNAIATIDKAGRLVVPKAMRLALHLEPGDVLEMRQEGETLVLAPKHEKGRMFKAEDGLWVFSSGQGRVTNEEINQAIADTRLEREARILGSLEDEDTTAR